MTWRVQKLLPQAHPHFVATGFALPGKLSLVAALRLKNRCFMAATKAAKVSRIAHFFPARAEFGLWFAKYVVAGF